MLQIQGMKIGVPVLAAAEACLLKARHHAIGEVADALAASYISL